MMGGYLEDRFNFGSEDIGYSFCYWHLVDVFVYFSHHFITIPPVNWVECATKNSVPILGTLITEGKSGFNFCERMFASGSTMEVVVFQLVQIAKAYHLNGWLINIENDIRPKHVPVVVEMLRLLNKSLSRITEEPIVVWYDSILRSGQVRWQNELNDNNKVFLQDTGAYMFTNYWWNETKLALMNQRFGEFADRIFVGVDVFGRGVVVGGPGFEIYEAVEAIVEHGLSVALFAPGWTWETFGKKSIYWDMEKMFWETLGDFLKSRRYPLPLKSSFCRGFGLSTWSFGKMVGDKRWNCIGLQQPQLNSCQSTAESREDPVSVGYEDRLAYSGGNCLRFAVSPNSIASPIVKNILRLSAKCTRLCIICYYNVSIEFPYDLFFEVLTETGDALTVHVAQQFMVDDTWHRKMFFAVSTSISSVDLVSLLLVPKRGDNGERTQHDLLLGQLEIFTCDDLFPRLPTATRCGYWVDYSLDTYFDHFMIKIKDRTHCEYFIVWREGESSSLFYVGRTFLPYFIVESSDFRYLVEAIPL